MVTETLIARERDVYVIKKAAQGGAAATEERRYGEHSLRFAVAATPEGVDTLRIQDADFACKKYRETRNESGKVVELVEWVWDGSSFPLKRERREDGQLAECTVAVSVKRGLRLNVGSRELACVELVYSGRTPLWDVDLVITECASVPGAVVRSSSTYRTRGSEKIVQETQSEVVAFAAPE